MADDIKTIHDKIFSYKPKNSDQLFYSMDYSMFDTMISSTDIHKIKSKFGKDIGLKRIHMDLESFDYPLIDGKTKDVILSRADRLMSGDYITAVMSIATQMSNFEMIELEWEQRVEPKVIIGDDSLVVVDKNFDFKGFQDFMIENGSPINNDKSLVDRKLVSYNRRIWSKDCYPFNSFMTYINAIYRDERIKFDNINHQDRLYQIYVSYVSAMVVLKYYPKKEEIKQVFTREVQKLTGTTLQFIHTVDSTKGKVELINRGIKRPLFEDIKYIVDMKFVDFNFFKE
jgi:hypothetical protein